MHAPATLPDVRSSAGCDRRSPRGARRDKHGEVLCAWPTGSGRSPRRGVVSRPRRLSRIAAGARPTSVGREPRVRMCVVDQGVEGFPVCQREVRRGRGSRVPRAALCAPAQLLGVGQGRQIVESHHLSGQCQLTLSSRCGNQFPDTGRTIRSQHRVGASVALPRLGHTLDLVHRPGGEIAHVQELDDGSGGSAGILRLPRRTLLRCRRREDAGVGQAARVHGQRPAQPCQGGDGEGAGVAVRADESMGQSAPGAAVAGRVGEAGADVPAVFGGHLGYRQFMGVQADGAVADPVVPLDVVAAVTTTTALSAAQ
ncbi:hypothetical protein HMPREF1211_06088 [Streptomyces sp. HGB0020]|nr:hypothetical protein HMPREF1211_06088 [Streptomyces sp. HGB0020]